MFKCPRVRACIRMSLKMLVLVRIAPARVGFVLDRVGSRLVTGRLTDLQFAYS
jgi:hypothetical protein